MANRIKHIALQTENPAETADWYKSCLLYTSTLPTKA